MSLPFYRYLTVDNNKYAIEPDTYSMQWQRAFTSQLAGNIIRLNFVDRGPGIRIYTATLILETWASNTLPYSDGITTSWDTQLQALETSFIKTSTVLQFQDPFGRTAGSAGHGVFFTSYNLTIHKASTPDKVICLPQCQFTEATQVVA